MFVCSVSIIKKKLFGLATAHVLHRTQRNTLWWRGLALNRAGSGNNKKKGKTGTRPNPEKKCFLWNISKWIIIREEFGHSTATIIYIGSKAYPCTCSITINNASYIPQQYRFTKIHFIFEVTTEQHPFSIFFRIILNFKKLAFDFWLLTYYFCKGMILHKGQYTFRRKKSFYF